ncbi:hypothetical protein Gasu2_47010 [Galdieria sulphuraria]|uniref:Uncharacterized protein n=1 Tax=Galdieria sulphuraria TaxID=130081 RepID=M2X5E5_GALSU|nr:uncharacterized protein Gasu_10940 [Galdieria sulphuraria]EME31715.1 hypothetical protein Gasu_10940 [Galdieria sulphuraria]GJD10515.1 hypothetical protein Gasu2_47010 [Galdieria sulphuraria]|eukprot:XP_005708235.1 hypothetical protein Gasu_10940 [Galdieria sulphuraria]
MRTAKSKWRFFCKGSFKRCYENGCPFVIPSQISELILIQCPIGWLESSEPIQFFSKVCVCTKQKSLFDEWWLRCLAQENRQEEVKGKTKRLDTDPKEPNEQRKRKKVNKTMHKRPNSKIVLKAEGSKRVNVDDERNVTDGNFDNLLLLSGIATNFEAVSS